MISFNVHKRLYATSGSLEMNLSFDMQEGELVTFFGKSGAGKTTFLKIIAGLIEPDDGAIIVNGEQWFDKSLNINLPPQNRKVGFVFQEYALFQNMTVEENIVFALDNRKEKSFLDSLIRLIDLDEIRHRRPSTLSGGQAQRVALARAIAREPALLLLDEPLSAIDRDTRLKLQDQILKIHQQFHIATILVSHDLGEIFKLSNRVIKIDNGKLIASGKPIEIFLDKKMSSKFRFTGEVLEIEKNDMVYVITVLIGNDIVKVIASEQEIVDLHPGDRVVVGSKAFNPILMKI
ncbi:MAG: sulfate/molybdate ABC transporter ATP-binding protein [Bacteroidota bacterium]